MLEANEKDCKKPKCELKVYTRFSDKVTFIALIVGVALSFIICMFLYAYEFFQTADFWEEGAKCIATQDFKCLLDIRVEQTIAKDMAMTIMGASMSFIGVIFGTLAVTLYKSVTVKR